MASKGESQCRYCWNPQAGQHNEGCPIKIGTPKAMKAWERGYELGFSDEIVPYYWHNSDKSWVLGFRAGEAHINQLVEEALWAERNHEWWK